MFVRDFLSSKSLNDVVSILLHDFFFLHCQKLICRGNVEGDYQTDLGNNFCLFRGKGEGVVAAQSIPPTVEAAFSNVQSIPPPSPLMVW